MVPVEVLPLKRREPFFKKSHRAWYVPLDGRQVRLSADAPEAWDKYHELMAARKKAEKFVTPGEPPSSCCGRRAGPGRKITC